MGQQKVLIDKLKADEEIDLYDAALEIGEQGEWAWRQARGGKVNT
jgi:hypothetical protein